MKKPQAFTNILVRNEWAILEHSRLQIHEEGKAREEDE